MNMHVHTFMIIYLEFLLEWELFQTEFVEKVKTIK